MSLRHLLASAAAFAVVCTPSIAAQQPRAGIADTTRLEELVVTATRSEKPRRAVPATVSVISGAELEARGFRFVTDWLREVPGVTVVPTGSFGGVTSLFLRGGESDYTKVLVDGVPVNQPGGAIDLASLSVEQVERIEVLRGPASVLYGSDAVTGVVQILTRRGSGPGRLSLMALAGTHATTDLRAGYAGGTERVSWAVGASRFGSRGTYAFNSDYRSWTGNGRVAFRPDPRTDLALSVRTGDHQAHFPTDFAGVLADTNQFSTERGTTVGLQASRWLGSTVQLTSGVGVYRSRRGFDDAPDGPADTAGYGFASTRDGRAGRVVVDAGTRWAPVAELHLAGGVEWSRETAEESSTTRSNFGTGSFAEEGRFQAERVNRGWYGQAEWSASPQVDVHGGFRLEDNSVFGGFATWRVGAVTRPASGWRLHVSAGSAFRQPSFPEQFADTPFEVGDPDLDPERTVSWEIGTEATLAGDAVVVTAVWFDQSFRDLIQYGYTAPGEPTYANVARAEARGLELGARFRMGPQWTAAAGYTRLSTRVSEAGSPGVGFQPGERLLRRPTHSGSIGVWWQGGSGARIGFDMLLVGSRDDVDYRTFPAERVPLDPYQLASVSVDLPFAALGAGRYSELGFSARVENLFGEAYQTVVGFPGRGRIVMAGFRLGR